MGMDKKALALTLALAAPGAGMAADFAVNSAADAVDSNVGDGVCMTADGECTLRAAIQEANASAGADNIDLMDGVYDLSLEGVSEDAAATGDLDITSEITVNGNGADVAKIDGMASDRVFHVHESGKLTLNALTVRNGRISENGRGGGVENRGELIINDANITFNHAAGMGGGINNFMGTAVLNRVSVSNNTTQNAGAGVSNQDGSLTINDSTINNNGGLLFPGAVFGGGVYNSAFDGGLKINNSTVINNEVFLEGGGVYHLVGTFEITNSTISDNSAGRNGGGLFVGGQGNLDGSANVLVNSTIAFNDAEAYDSAKPEQGKGGGGIYVTSRVSMQMANTIVAGNAIGSDCAIDGQIISLGNNLDTDGSCELATDTSSISAGSAGLGGLADNGGPTPTHALLTGSDALNAGDDAQCPDTDQRGYSRPASGCDIGAFEAAATPPANEADAPPPNDGTSTDADNTQPLAFPLPVAVTAGGSVSAVANGVDSDGDELTYEVVQPPTQGVVGWGSTNNNAAPVSIPGEFTYVANADATGMDSFTYRACDQLICSEPAQISIVINPNPVSGEVNIEIAPDSGTVGPIQVVSSSALEAVAPDVGYDQPLGVIFFDVANVPTDADSQLNGTTITIQLPSDAAIDSSAVIRKLDNTGVWRTLQSDPSPNVTTGTIDPVAKTITLVLRDGDMFDLNRAVGVISDPVAVAVPRQMTMTDDASVSSESSGGGVLHPMLLALSALLGFIGRRRFR